jgi:hypothetical protein
MPATSVILVNGPVVYGDYPNGQKTQYKPVSKIDPSGLVEFDAGPFWGPTGSYYCHISRPGTTAERCHKPSYPATLFACLSTANARMILAAAADDSIGFDDACDFFAQCLNNYYD